MFWESNKGEGVKRGNEKRENGGEWIPRVGLTEGFDQFTRIGPTKK